MSKVVFISSPAPKRDGLSSTVLGIALYLSIAASCIGFWVIVVELILHLRGKL